MVRPSSMNAPPEKRFNMPVYWTLFVLFLNQGKVINEETIL